MSTPAVNKWEKGISCPDITILPALARLLKTDLNTLLSFHEDLTDMEIANFVETLDHIAQEQNYESAFQTALERIQEYPTCETLLYSVTFYLEGALFLYHVPEREHYKKMLEEFYNRLSASECPEIREAAIGMLISYHWDRGDFDKAEELINTLPNSTIDAQQHLATLYTFQEKYEEAQKILAHRILDSATKIQAAFMNLLEIALKENRLDDAAFFANLHESVCKQFDFPEWMSYSAHLELAVATQDQERCQCILQKMLPAMKEKEQWHLQDSRLYHNLDGNTSSLFFSKLTDTILNDIKNDEAFSFIRGNAEQP